MTLEDKTRFHNFDSFDVSLWNKIKLLGGSYVLGLGLAGIGRAAAGDYSLVVPGILPAIGVMNGSNTSFGLLTYLSYGVGVATAYIDKIASLSLLHPGQLGKIAGKSAPFSTSFRDFPMRILI